MFMVQYIERMPAISRRWRAFAPAPSCTRPGLRAPLRHLSHGNRSGSGVTRTARWPPDRFESGRAAVDGATRNILYCGSSGIYAAGLPSGEEKLLIRLWRSLRHRFHRDSPKECPGTERKA